MAQWFAFQLAVVALMGVNSARMYGKFGDKTEEQMREIYKERLILNGEDATEAIVNQLMSINNWLTHGDSLADNY